MYISIAVNKIPGSGAMEFLEALPELLETSRTWEITAPGYLSVTIESTATISSLPAQPRYTLAENAAGSVQARLENRGWSADQQAEAAKYLVYLCLTALAPRVAEIRIDV
jgi:hypothetical protein